MGKEKTVPMEFSYSFEEMVKALNGLKERGERAFLNFNGHTFYSLSFDENEAYIECYDMTKEEYKHYKDDRYRIILGMLRSSYANNYVPFEEFAGFAIRLEGAKSPEVLQVYEYALRNAGDIITGEENPEYLDRFNHFSDKRKEVARNFINEFISEEYKSKVFEGLGLTQKQM